MDRATRKAQGLFRRVWQAAGRDRLWARLRQRPDHLLNLGQVTAGRGLEQRRYEGVQTIALDRIVGSENRSGDFDPAFRPIGQQTEERWVRLAAAVFQGETLPPVDLIRVNDAYFVRDGHHRVSIARALKQQFIDAQVTAWQEA